MTNDAHAHSAPASRDRIKSTSPSGTRALQIRPRRADIEESQIKRKGAMKKNFKKFKIIQRYLLESEWKNRWNEH
jgi:hypothetical protein